jgi:hypothetical protein
MAPKRRLADSTDSSSDGSSKELPNAAAVHSFLRLGDQLASRTASRRYLESLDALYPDCGGLANTFRSYCSVYVLETDDAGATRERFPHQARTWTAANPGRCAAQRRDRCFYKSPFLYQAELASYLDYHCRLEVKPNDGSWTHAIRLRGSDGNLQTLVTVISNDHVFELTSYGELEDVFRSQLLPRPRQGETRSVYGNSRFRIGLDDGVVKITLNIDRLDNPGEQVCQLVRESRGLIAKFAESVHRRILREIPTVAIMESSLVCSRTPDNEPRGWTRDGDTLSRERTECRVYFL